MLTLKHQCPTGLAPEAKELREKLAEREKANDASKTTPEERKKRPTAAEKRAAVLKKVLSSVKALHLRRAKMATRSEADDNRARKDLRDAQARFVEVEQKARLARDDLHKVRKQFAGSAKAAENSSG